jgi:hypothetical protein
MDAVPEVDPATQAYPAVQLPEQAEVVRPVVLPKVPAGQGAVQLEVVNRLVFPNLPLRHGVHDPKPAKLYDPGAQATAVALVLAAGHA